MIAYFLVGLLLGLCVGAGGVCIHLINHLGNIWDDLSASGQPEGR